MAWFMMMMILTSLSTAVVVPFKGGQRRQTVVLAAWCGSRTIFTKVQQWRHQGSRSSSSTTPCSSSIFARAPLRRRQHDYHHSPFCFSTSSSKHSSIPSHQDDKKDFAHIRGFQPVNATSVVELKNQAIQFISEMDPSLEPEDSVHHLLAAAFDLSWEEGWKQIRDDTVRISLNETNDPQRSLFQSFVQRRVEQREPLQYILGKWDFLDHVFLIRPPLLCPRPETEELVLMVMKRIRQELQEQQNDNDDDDSRLESSAKDDSPGLDVDDSHKGSSKSVFRVLDVGSGTGAIGVSIAATSLDSVITNGRPTPRIEVTALDVEPVAVETSLENAKRILDGDDHGYTCLLCNAADFVVVDDEEDGRFDLVVSNPPYIPRRDWKLLDPMVREYESETALCGDLPLSKTHDERGKSSHQEPNSADGDGLDVIRILLDQLPRWCKRGATCWMEVDPSQPTRIAELLESNHYIDYTATHKDLSGRDRFVELRVVCMKRKGC